jgi:hypothetical protein
MQLRQMRKYYALYHPAVAAEQGAVMALSQNQLIDGILRKIGCSA